MVVSLNMGVSPSMEVNLRVDSSTTELARRPGQDLDYQVRVSHHPASFQASLCSLYPTITNPATLVQFLRLYQSLSH